jgi:hypothetical protein
MQGRRSVRGECLASKKAGRIKTKSLISGVAQQSFGYGKYIRIRIREQRTIMVDCVCLSVYSRAARNEISTECKAARTVLPMGGPPSSTFGLLDFVGSPGWRFLMGLPLLGGPGEAFYLP